MRSPQHRGRLLSIFQQRKYQGELSPEIRKLALDDIKAAGALSHTKELIDQLQREVEEELGKLDERTGVKNWILRLIQWKLKI